MLLKKLPPEIVEEIVPFTLPEGFESLALVCKATFQICKPYIEQHNQLRKRYRLVSFELEHRRSFGIKAAFPFITYFASEPRGGRYVENLLARRDTFNILMMKSPMPVEYDLDAVTKLFRDSRYLRLAGLDWQEYLQHVVDDWEHVPFSNYSQHAAAFLLTLLPNVRHIVLPGAWQSVPETDKLVDTIVTRAQQPNNTDETLSLAKLIRFDDSPGGTGAAAMSMLRLPDLKAFQASYVCSHDGENDLPKDISKSLTTLNLERSFIDVRGITSLLNHTPKLRRFRYEHKSGHPRWDPNPVWDIARFTAAIETAVGEQLEELYLSFENIDGPCVPGKLSFRNYRQLRVLEFPLDGYACSAKSATPDSNVTEGVYIGQAAPKMKFTENDGLPVLRNLIPSSLEQLELRSTGKIDHAYLVHHLFSDYSKQQQTISPNVKTIHLDFRETAREEYQDECFAAQRDCAKAKVDLHLCLKDCDAQKRTSLC